MLALRGVIAKLASSGVLIDTLIPGAILVGLGIIYLLQGNPVRGADDRVESVTRTCPPAVGEQRVQPGRRGAVSRARARIGPFDAPHHIDADSYHCGIAMTLRLPPELDAELRAAAEEDHRSLHQAVVLAVEIYLAQRETAEIKADPETLRAIAEARDAVRSGDVVYGTDAARALLKRHRAS